MRLLLVEDDIMIGESIRAGLQQAHYAVDWIRDGAAAEPAVALHTYALVLLDLGLPRKSGLDVLRALRRRRIDIPVLVITARDAIEKRIEGLDAGADDYVIKPFDLDELLARVRALLRRAAGRSVGTLVAGELTLDPVSMCVSHRGSDVLLSPREFALLRALLERPGAVLSRAQLEERLYGWGDEVESNAIEVHIHNLRKKLGGDILRNVRGAGYFVVDKP